MARYRAIRDIDTGREQFSEGQVIDASEVPSGYLGSFELVVPKRGSAEIPQEAPEPVINPDREALKALADELELPYPANISTVKLQAMIDKHYADQAKD